MTHLNFSGFLSTMKTVLCFFKTEQHVFIILEQNTLMSGIQDQGPQRTKNRTCFREV